MARVSDLNCVILVGNLTRDAEMSYMPSGNAVVNFSLAINRSKKEGDQWVSEANYFDVAYFGKPAEAVKPYLTKGKKIAVQGSLKQDRWEKDGQKFSKVRIVADSVQLLGGRSDSDDSSSFGGYQGNSSFAPRTSSPQSQDSDYYGQSSGADTFGGDAGAFTEDIPF